MKTKFALLVFVVVFASIAALAVPRIATPRSHQERVNFLECYDDVQNNNGTVTPQIGDPIDSPGGPT